MKGRFAQTNLLTHLQIYYEENLHADGYVGSQCWLVC